jgi:hypothetical protein
MKRVLLLVALLALAAAAPRAQQTPTASSGGTPHQITFPMFFGGKAAGANPAASTTYFFFLGLSQLTGDPSTTAATTVGPVVGIARVPMRIVSANLQIVVLGTLSIGGSAGTMNVRINNSTDSQILSGLAWSSGSSTYENAALNITLNTNDWFQIKFTTPAWSTPPTAVYEILQLNAVTTQ